MPIGLVQDPSVDLDRLDDGAQSLPVPQSARDAENFGHFDFTRRAVQFGQHLVADTLGIDPADPMGATGGLSDSDARLPSETANEQYGVEGYLRFNQPTTADDAAWMSAQAHERRFRDLVLSRTRPTPLRDFGASLAGSLVDPAGLGVMLATDGIGEAGLAAAGARLGLRTAADTGAAVGKLGRLGNLATEVPAQLAKGALLNAPYVGLDAALSNYAGDDFSMGDALSDIAAGAILHTGLHLSGKALHAVLGRAPDPAAPPAGYDPAGTPPDAVQALHPESRAGALAKALDDLTDDRPVDVGQYVARELDAQGEPRGFTTADGSVYAIGEDGLTQRAEPRAGDALALQPAAEATHYLAPDDAVRLEDVHRAGGAIATTPDGYLGVRDAAGSFDGRALIQPAAGPAPGLVPVEVRGQGTDAHFGHPIAEVRYDGANSGANPLDFVRQDRAAQARARKAAQRADAAARAEANTPETRRRIAAVEADPRTQRLRAAADQLKAFAADKRVPGADVLERVLNDASLKTGHPIAQDVEDFLRGFFKDGALKKLQPRDAIRARLRGHADFDLPRRMLADLADRYARNDPGKLDLRAPGRAATPHAETPPLDLRPEPAKPEGEPGAKASARLTGDQLIAADPELKALLEDTEQLAARNGVDLAAAAEAKQPNTLAEAIRAAAVCLIGEMG